MGKNQMKYKRPPTTMKFIRKANSNLAVIRKTLLLVSQKDNEQFANVNYNHGISLSCNSESLPISDLTKQMHLYPEELFNVKSSSSVAKNKPYFRDHPEYVSNEYFPLSLSGSGLQSPIKQNSVDRIYSLDVRNKFKPNIWSNKKPQGKIGVVQDIEKIVATPNQASTEHELYKDINLSLLQVATNGDNLNEKMPITRRQQRLNMRKLNNLDDVVDAETPSEDSVTLRDSTAITRLSEDVVVSSFSAKELSSQPENYQRRATSSISSSSESVVVRTVVEALIEPRPEDRGRCSTPLQKTNKKYKHVAKAFTQIDFDAIEISRSKDSRANVRPKRQQINLPRTLMEINRNVDLNKMETTILARNQKRPGLRSQLSAPEISRKLINENEGESAAQECQMYTDKKNNNTYLANNNDNPKKTVGRKKGRACAQTKYKRAKIQRENVETDSTDMSDSTATAQKMNERVNNVSKRITKNTNTFDNFNTLLSSIQENVLNKSSPKMLAKTTTANNRQLSYKTHSFLKKIPNKSYSKNYIDTVMRLGEQDGYESLYSDNEPLSTTTCKRVNKTVFTSPKRLELNSSSSLPELQIEMEEPARLETVERLTSSGSLFENYLPEATVVLPKNKALPNATVIEQVENDRKAKVSSQVVHGDTCISPELEAFHSSQDFSKLDKNDDVTESSEVISNSRNILETNSTCWPTSTLEETEAHVKQSDEAIMSWVATGLPCDAAEGFKSIAEAALSGYINMFRAYLHSVKGPVHPSLKDMHEMLVKCNHDFENYLKEK